MREIKRN